MAFIDDLAAISSLLSGGLQGVHQTTQLQQQRQDALAQQQARQRQLELQELGLTQRADLAREQLTQQADLASQQREIDIARLLEQGIIQGDAGFELTEAERQRRDVANQLTQVQIAEAKAGAAKDRFGQRLASPLQLSRLQEFGVVIPEGSKVPAVEAESMLERLSKQQVAETRAEVSRERLSKIQSMDAKDRADLRKKLIDTREKLIEQSLSGGINQEGMLEQIALIDRELLLIDMLNNPERVKAARERGESLIQGPGRQSQADFIRSLAGDIPNVRARTRGVGVD